MKNKLNFRILLTAIIALTMLLNTACSKDDKDKIIDGPSNYSLGTVIDEVSYILSSNDLTNGSISPIGNGIEFGTAEFIQSGNYIYFFTRDEKKFYQYELNKDGTVTEVASLLLTQYITDRAYSQNLIDETTILIMDPLQWGEPEIKWVTISLPDFVISASGTYSLPTLEKEPGVNWNVNVGRGALHGDKFVMGTVYYDFDGNFAEGSHAILLDYPSMSNPTRIGTDLTDAELGIFTNNSFIKSDNGDLYIAGYRGFYGKPSDDDVKGVLFRIKNGEYDFDESYLLDFTEELGVSTQIIQLNYTEGGQAMGMLFNDTEIGEWDNLDNDHYYFATIDLASKKVTKLDVPKNSCRLSRVPLIGDGKYITYFKSTASNTTNVIEIDYNTGIYTNGIQVVGSNVIGYSIAKHPNE